MKTRQAINPEDFLKKNSTVSALTKNTKKSAEDGTEAAEKKETKSERTTVLFRKTSWADYVVLAHALGRTPNDLLNEYLDKVTAANADIIKRHREEQEENKRKMKNLL